MNIYYCYKKFYKIFLIILVLVFAGSRTTYYAQQLAFPGAEGFGKYTKGGRGGKVIEVTNLNDSGHGSLREAINASGPRTVIFRVSGTISLKSPLNINNPYITIAGQTAPGDGICIKNYSLNINTHDVIIRYLRFRLGDVSGTESDAMSARQQKNIIIDHCSLSWSVDETMSLYWCDSLTVQWCIISESLYNSNHYKGAHGYGGIWGGANSTYHHNLFAHHSSRTPRFASGSGNTDFRNNVIYNWGFNNVYGGEAHDPNWQNSPLSTINVVANYYKPGPATLRSVQYRIVNPSTRSGLEDYGKWYVADNYVEGYQNATEDNWTYGVQGPSASDRLKIKSDVPFNYIPINQQNAQEAYQLVLDNVGAILPRRDVVDKRIIDEVRRGYATFEGVTYKFDRSSSLLDPNKICGIIDSQNDVGGWPKLNTGNVPVDSDHDGMPDEWEMANNLNPENPEDRNIIREDGYTMLEVYLNSIKEFPDFIPAPTNLKSELINTNTIKLSWEDNSDDETGFIIQRKKENEDFISIDTVSSNITTYIDRDLPDFTKFIYRIVAYNESLKTASELVEILTLSAHAAPLPATTPIPKDNEKNVVTSITLSWNFGLNSESHDIYFGTINPPPFICNQKSKFFKPDSLENGKTYYWRVNEVNQFGKTEGQVWSFTTKFKLPPQMIGYWKFDEGENLIIEDNSNFKNHGNLINMSGSAWSNGIFGNALKFDGIDDYVLVPYNGIFDFSKESFSISLWLKIGNIPQTSMYLLSKGSFVKDTTIGHFGKWYGLELKNNQLRFSIDDDIFKTVVSISNVDTLLKNKWNNIIAIRDSVNKLLKLFINGKLVNQIDDRTGDISEYADLYFGNTLDKNATLLGELDDIRFYNYALNEQQILEIYNEFITNVNEYNLIPDEYVLNQNYPNPFNPITTITFRIPYRTYVKLTVYNSIGEKIQTLISKELNAGTHSVIFNAVSLTSGVYFYKLETDYFISTKKMTLLK